MEFLEKSVGNRIVFIEIQIGLLSKYIARTKKKL